MLEALIEIVRRAGDMVLSAHDIQNVTREKHGPADLVTQYDEAVQAFLRRELLRLLPEPLLLLLPVLPRIRRIFLQLLLRVRSIREQTFR